MVYGYPEQYYNEKGDLIYDTNPAVKEAWQLSSDAADEDLTAKLRQFQPGWDPGLSNGTFATAVCPAWMLSHISEKAGEVNKGKWDVARAPKGANWGGSFLGVIEDSPVKEEAKKLVAWLTAPEQQARIFKDLGNIPSSQKALEDPTVKAVKNDYFSGAPLGQIFGAAAQEIPDKQVLGRKDGTIRTPSPRAWPWSSRGRRVTRRGTPPWSASRRRSADRSSSGRPGPARLRVRGPGTAPHPLSGREVRWPPPPPRPW